MKQLRAIILGRIHAAWVAITGSAGVMLSHVLYYFRRHLEGALWHAGRKMQRRNMCVEAMAAMLAVWRHRLCNLITCADSSAA